LARYVNVLFLCLIRHEISVVTHERIMCTVQHVSMSPHSFVMWCIYKKEARVHFFSLSDQEAFPGESYLAAICAPRRA